MFVPVLVIAVVVVVAFGLLVAVWWRSESRIVYRHHRRLLGRTRRRWATVAQRLTADGRQDREAAIRQLEHALALAGQALTARRRTTGLVSFVRQVRGSHPPCVETPFERVYLVEAHRLLDRIDPGPAVAARAKDGLSAGDRRCEALADQA